MFTLARDATKWRGRIRVIGLYLLAVAGYGPMVCVEWTDVICSWYAQMWLQHMVRLGLKVNICGVVVAWLECTDVCNAWNVGAKCGMCRCCQMWFWNVGNVASNWAYLPTDSNSHSFNSDGHQFWGHGPLGPSLSATVSYRANFALNIQQCTNNVKDSILKRIIPLFSLKRKQLTTLTRLPVYTWRSNTAVLRMSCLPYRLLSTGWVNAFHCELKRHQREVWARWVKRGRVE